MLLMIIYIYIYIKVEYGIREIRDSDLLVSNHTLIYNLMHARKLEKKE
jgi:hypothetical protein